MDIRRQGRPLAGAGVLLAGLLCGATTQWAHTTEPAGRDRFVVELKSTKLVTLAKTDLTLQQTADELKRQTGYTFTLGARFQDDKRTLSVFLRAAPLGDVLRATGFLVKGVWERKGSGYTLRPMTSKELAMDTVRFDYVLETVERYLASVDAKDPALDERKQMEILSFRELMKDRAKAMSGMGGPTDGWLVKVGDNVLAVSASSGSTSGNKTTGGVTNHWWGF